MENNTILRENCINKIGDILFGYRPNKIFLVTGKNSFVQSGAQQALQSLENKYQISHFTDFASLPLIEDVEKGINFFHEQNCDLVLAIGGGHVIDMAKLITGLQHQSQPYMDFIENKRILEKRQAPLVVVPTTAGSGSEATQFAVVYYKSQKYSLDHPQLIPDNVLIDPSLMLSATPLVRASAGADVLSHAIESYWSVNSTNESKGYAKDAIILIMNHFVDSIKNPSMESMLSIAKAANLAGRAINISKTTACHAISYPLTAHYNMAHGQAVILTLPHILEFNAHILEQEQEQELNDPRGAEYFANTLNELFYIMNAKNFLQAKEYLINLTQEVGLRTTLVDLGLTAKDIPLILEEGFNIQRVRNNPRILSRTVLEKILLKLV